MKKLKRNQLTIFLVLIFLPLILFAQVPVTHGLRVQSHTICYELDRYDNPIRFKSDFTERDTIVISWIKLVNVDGPYTCLWVWQDPSKNTWTEASVEITGERRTENVYSIMPLEAAVFEKPGFWSVLFYTNDQYQFTDHFTILSTKPVTTKTTTTAVTTSQEPEPYHLIEIVDVKSTPEQGVELYPGDFATFIITLKNSGTAPASAVKIELLGVPAGVKLAEESNPTNLQVGEVKEVRLKFLCEEAGYYEFAVRVLVNDDPLEGTIPFTISVSPLDIFIEPVDVKTIPGEGEEVNPGDEVTFIFSLKNTGTTPARTVEMKPTGIPEGIKLIETTPPSEIKPGEVKDFTLRFLCEKAGTYKFQGDLLVLGDTLDSVDMEISVTEPFMISWSIVAIPLIIIAIIAAALLLYRRRKTRQISAPSIAEKGVLEEARFCIHCGAPIDDQTKFCGRCGKPQI